MHISVDIYIYMHMYGKRCSKNKENQENLAEALTLIGAARGSGAKEGMASTLRLRHEQGLHGAYLKDQMASVVQAPMVQASMAHVPYWDYSRQIMRE